MSVGKMGACAAVTSAAAAAAVLVLGLQASASGVAGSTDACQLISQAKLKSVLGLSNIGGVRDIPGHQYPNESDGMVHATCFGVAWSGAKPTSRKQSEEKLANGTGAEWGWETYATDTGAPPEDLQRWVGPTTVNGKPDVGGYQHVLAGLEGGNIKAVIALLAYLHETHGSEYSPPRLGAQRAGAYVAGIPNNAVLNHVRVAGAYWADDSSHAIFDMALVEGKNASAIKKKLETIAKIAVPAFGL
jgi:hypothetical protein